MMDKKEIKKNDSLFLVFFIPFIVTNVLLFFELINSNDYLKDLLQDSQNLLEINTFKFNLFMGIIVVLFNVIILFVTFLFIKIVIQLVLRKEFFHERDLLITLLLSASLSAITSLLLSEFFSIGYFALSITTSILEYVMFVLLYRVNIKDNKEVIMVAGVKLILLTANIIFVITM
ncbi:hypothetical protein MPS01_12520 [Marinilactibacillus psychrotolerans]|uniref:Uncharacterized protein n=2 Tax=Marinilactibacillus psychrotolerans TaxID=191770 RepID=A0AAV3WVS1_9LACT|nr:hypothetical protein MPS01_12520 [Marinilactibacillus psychrotolerans]GEQ36242.1 hypothetical protein M132T_17500 [Marinilactibacillus psychrotolerans]SDC79716.1 hypothetical protein SAMN04488013_109103 [Marinilactibacillus psychrotolerans]